MLRLIVAVVVGYLVMMILVVLAFSLSIVVPDFAFQRDSFNVTPGWLAYALFASASAALAGGFSAATFARKRTGANALAIMALVLGLGSAGGNFMKERPATTESPAHMTPIERGSKAVQPHWYAFTLPFLAAACIVLGGRLRGDDATKSRLK